MGVKISDLVEYTGDPSAGMFEISINGTSQKYGIPSLIQAASGIRVLNINIPSIAASASYSYNLVLLTGDYVQVAYLSFVPSPSTSNYVLQLQGNSSPNTTYYLTAQITGNHVNNQPFTIASNSGVIALTITNSSTTESLISGVFTIVFTNLNASVP